MDAIQKIMGAFGKYHLFLTIIVFLSKFPIAWHQMAIIFLAPKVTYVCLDTNKTSCPCPNPKFDKSEFSNTITMEWNLICERKMLGSFAQSIFQLGTLIGSVPFGMASDRFGRKFPMCVAIVMQVASGVSAAFAPQLWLFNLLRFIVGCSVGGTMVIGFVILMEFVGPAYRDILSALYQIPFNLGHLTLPVYGYFIRDYKYFQLGISVPVAILLLYFCILPETPRWLLAAKKIDPAVELLTKVAKINNRPVDNIRSEVEAYQEEIEKHQLKKRNILDLFKTPNLRKNILVMSYNWLTCSYCFYGVSQYVGQLGGNVFTNVAAAAGVTFFGTLCSIPILKLLGRKTILIGLNFACGVCLLILAAIPEGIGSVICACIGSVTSFIAFGLVYLYGSELFPTVVRNAAIGFSSMMARVGSMIAPFVVDLKPTAEWLPPLLFAIVPLIATALTFLLPETKGAEMLTTIEEGEAFGKKRKPTRPEKSEGKS